MIERIGVLLSGGNVCGVATSADDYLAKRALYLCAPQVPTVCLKSPI